MRPTTGPNRQTRETHDFNEESVHTDGQPFCAVGLQAVGEDGQEGEQTARYDDPDDVVERIAVNPQRERRPGKRLTAAVRHQRVRYLHVCVQKATVSSSSSAALFHL